VDDEAEGLKRSVEVRQKEVENLRAENETLRMRQFELLEANYGLSKDTEEAMEVINEAKEISKILGVRICVTSLKFPRTISFGRTRLCLDLGEQQGGISAA